MKLRLSKVGLLCSTRHAPRPKLPHGEVRLDLRYVQYRQYRLMPAVHQTCARRGAAQASNG